MKAVLQRVRRAEVRVGGETVSRIGRGVVVLLGVMKGDGPERARGLAERIARFRFFPDDAGRMNLSLLEVAGEVLVVSQITLAADGRRGRRPSFDDAAEPEAARTLYARFVAALTDLGLACATGVFGAAMEVELVNDGPVTFVLEEGPGPGSGPPSQALA